MSGGYGTALGPPPGAAAAPLSGTLPPPTAPASGAYGYGSYGSPGEQLPSLKPPPPASAMQGSMERPPSEHSILRSGGSLGKLGTLQSHVNVLEFIVMPWGLLVLVLASFLQQGALGYFWSVQFVPALLVVLGAWFTRHHYVRSNNPEVILGILCLVAILLSTAVGEYAMWNSLSEYHRLARGASYFNVLPDEAAGGKLDAATIVFTDGTRVDTTRTFGFTDVTNEEAPVYCVAPVSDGNLYDNRIQYWAAGINCCETRSNFNCFRPDSIGAEGATVLPKEAKLSSGFQNAVQGAVGAYGLTSGDEYLLLTWTKDPVAHRDGLWSGTLKLFGIMAFVYLLISGMIGFAVAPVVGAADKYA